MKTVVLLLYEPKKKRDEEALIVRTFFLLITLAEEKYDQLYGVSVRLARGHQQCLANSQT